MQSIEVNQGSQTEHPVAELLLGPELDVKTKSVAIHLVPNTDMEACRFWLGLFNDGTLTAAELMDKGSLKEIFTSAATLGLAESTPVMLSDTTLPQDAKYIYLLPEPLKSRKQQEIFMNNIVETVNAWSPRAVGIYLAPELVSKASFRSLFKDSMQELIRKTTVSEYFVLPGAHGINSFINAVLSIKRTLDQESIAVYLFH